MNFTTNETYSILLNAIKEKAPQKQIVNILTDLLHIEREAVYRRLRGEVPFSFSEIVKISRAFSISIDSIIGINNSKSHPFQLKFIDYYNPTEVDYAMHEEFIGIVSATKDDVHSEAGYSVNMIPLTFSLKHEFIHRFYTLRWLYQFGDPGSCPRFSEISFPDRLKELFQRYLHDVQYFRSTFFIWDSSVFTNLINDIKYFNSIRLVSDEDVKLLKSEIADFLDYLEKLSIHGAFPNGHKVDIYISSLNFETAYSYIHANQYNITMIKAFGLNEVSSLDIDIFNKTRRWLQALKRTSVLVSGSGENSRIQFFEAQRDMLEKNL